LTGASLLAGVVALAGCDLKPARESVRLTESHRFTVDGVPVVELDTFDGAIDVRAWDRPEVQVDVEKAARSRAAAESLRVDAVQDGSRIRVVVKATGGPGSLVTSMAGASRSARLIVMVPRLCDLTLRSGEGRLSVERVRGTLRLSAVEGTVRGVELEGDVEVDATDGSVKLDCVGGRVRVTSGQGNVSVTGSPAQLAVRAGDGTVAVNLDRELRMDGDWDLATTDGAVVLTVPDDFAALLDAATEEGVVRIDKALAVSADRRTRHAVQGQLGDGGHRLVIRTANGAISLRAARETRPDHRNGATR
jgi:hypothetical protein